MVRFKQHKEGHVKKGFTLIEILVVLVVIGILVAAILPNALKAIEQANERSTASNLRNIDAAIQECYNAQPVNTTDPWAACGEKGDPSILAPTYMEAIPSNDPWGTAYTIIADPNGAPGYTSSKTAIFPHWPDITSHN